MTRTLALGAVAMLLSGCALLGAGTAPAMTASWDGAAWPTAVLPGGDAVVAWDLGGCTGVHAMWQPKGAFAIDLVRAGDAETGTRMVALPPGAGTLGVVTDACPADRGYRVTVVP